MGSPVGWAKLICYTVTRQYFILFVTRYLPHSFIVNTVSVEGPILCLPQSWLLWDVKGFNDITPDSLAILELIEPAPEVVIVGCGSRIRPLPPTLIQHLRARGIAVEALDTVSVGTPWRHRGLYRNSRTTASAQQLHTACHVGQQAVWAVLLEVMVGLDALNTPQKATLAGPDWCAVIYCCASCVSPLPPYVSVPACLPSFCCRGMPFLTSTS
jgi:uncharacterized protein